MTESSKNFRFFWDEPTGTFTYLLWAESGEAVIIDPVREQLDRDLKMISELGLTLKYVLETHVHADHVTAAAALRARTNAQVGLSKTAGARGADLEFVDGDEVRFGKETLKVWETPGHTDGCLSYLWQDRVFTGDALLIRKCGRTDFQQGDPRKLFRSVREKLFSLPDATWVHPGHEYEGREVSTIGEEKEFNVRLNLKITEDQFVAIMDDLKLDPPKRIEESVPANLKLGA